MEYMDMGKLCCWQCFVQLFPKQVQFGEHLLTIQGHSVVSMISEISEASN